MAELFAKRAATVVAIGTALFHLYTAFFGTLLTQKISTSLSSVRWRSRRRRGERRFWRGGLGIPGFTCALAGVASLLRRLRLRVRCRDDGPGFGRWDGGPARGLRTVP